MALKQQTIKVVCDQCKGALGMDAIVTCEVHSVDLCETHMRRHFDGAVCRLVPVKREPNEWERLAELLSRRK